MIHNDQSRDPSVIAAKERVRHVIQAMRPTPLRGELVKALREGGRLAFLRHVELLPDSDLKRTLLSALRIGKAWGGSNRLHADAVALIGDFAFRDDARRVGPYRHAL